MDRNINLLHNFIPVHIQYQRMKMWTLCYILHTLLYRLGLVLTFKGNLPHSYLPMSSILHSCLLKNNPNYKHSFFFHFVREQNRVYNLCIPLCYRIVKKYNCPDNHRDIYLSTYSLLLLLPCNLQIQSCHQSHPYIGNTKKKI